MKRFIANAISAAAITGLMILPARADTTITLVGYPVLFQENYTKAVIEPFEKENPGIKVTYFAQPNSALILGTLRAQKASPQSDVVIFDMTTSKVGLDEGLLVKLDETQIPNIKDLYPNARIPDIAGVGVTFDNLVVVYNADQIKEAPTSFMAMADKAYAGKVVIPAMPDIVGFGLTVLLDKANGGTNYLASLDKGIEALGKIAPNVQTWEPKPEVYAPILSGQAAIGVGWNARAQLNSKLSNGKLKAVLPKEGTAFQINTINLVAGSPNQDAAKKFINYALGAKAQKAFTEAMYYAPTNAKAEISEEALDRTAVRSMDKVVPIDWIALAKSRDAVHEQWRRKVIPLTR